MASPKLKILVCGILPPPNFGHSMMYKMLMESEFVRAFDITFLDLKFWSYAKHKKVTADKLFKLVKYWLRFVWAIVRRRPKYVLFNMSFDKMPFLKDYLFCMTGAMLGRRVVLHDMGQYLPELHGSTSGLLHSMLKHLLKHTYAIVVMGETVRQAYAPFFDAERIIVVPGVVEDSAGVSVPPRRSEKVEVLYFSFLSVSKGVWTALNAMPLVLEKNPNVHFTFAGPFESPQLQADIEAFIEKPGQSRFFQSTATQTSQNPQTWDSNESQKPGLSPFFTYAGYVSDVPARTALFRNCDLFIFPTHRDVFGLVITHAMAEGVPVIASQEGTIPEILPTEEHGLLFEKGNSQQLAEKILQLAADPARRQRMGRANRRRYAEQYTPEVYGRRMIEAFERIEQWGKP